MINDFTHHSPSSLNTFAMSPAMWVAEKVLGFKRPGSPQMHRGTAVEAGVAHGLKEWVDAAACTEIAMTRYDALTALSGDSRRQKVRDGIPEMVNFGLEALREYGAPDRVQAQITWQPDGVQYPIMGYSDFEWDHHGLVVDLKTTDKMPSEIKATHARQVAHYCNGNRSGLLVYVTPKKVESYALENVTEHRAALRQMAINVENFMALSEDPSFFVGVTVPDVESYLWSDPKARQFAWETWNI